MIWWTLVAADVMALMVCAMLVILRVFDEGE